MRAGLVGVLLSTVVSAQALELNLQLSRFSYEGEREEVKGSVVRAEASSGFDLSDVRFIPVVRVYISERMPAESRNETVSSLSGVDMEVRLVRQRGAFTCGFGFRYERKFLELSSSQNGSFFPGRRRDMELFSGILTGSYSSTVGTKRVYLAGDLFLPVTGSEREKYPTGLENVTLHRDVKGRALSFQIRAGVVPFERTYVEAFYERWNLKRGDEPFHYSLTGIAIGRWF